MTRPAASAVDGRLGVLLMTYGSPAGPEDMPRYLAAVRGGRPASDEVVAEFQLRYRAIGGSPLIEITRDQAAAVEERLGEAGVDARAAAGMRFSEPSIARALQALVTAGCSSVVGIVMSPQHSDLLMHGYRGALDDAARQVGWEAQRIGLAPAWYRSPRFLAAVAQRIGEGLDRLPPAERDRATVLLTAHSLPRRVADREPAYLDQLRATAEAVAARAGLTADRWQFCWQSAGHEPGEWMKPDFTDVLPRLRAAGDGVVLVAPIQFLADHLEVLYDIDIGARGQAEAAGMSFGRIESLNVMPEFIAALAQVAVESRPNP
ncbi:MAG: ferrochelatase [Candidatus Limnocylindria bacterium]